jgi:formate dehydrogenase subunit gamma
MADADSSEIRTVERFRKRTIILHWVHSAAFLVLAVTGAIILLYGTGYSNFNTGISLHRAAAAIFIIIPIVNYFLEPRSTSNFIKETFKWSRDDIRWLLAAPGYYFGGPEEKMPPQGRLNSGQKLWQALIIVTGLIFVVTGIAMWVFRLSLPISAYQWLLFVHGIAFVIILVMFLLHTYLAVFHPRFRESFRSMLDGRVSPTYARTHYRKWYEKEEQ